LEKAFAASQYHGGVVQGISATDLAALNLQLEQIALESSISSLEHDFKNDDRKPPAVERKGDSKSSNQRLSAKPLGSPVARRPSVAARATADKA
jgi:hypothetical protein